MIENLVFYNHWQNGDVHVSRGFIDYCIKNIKAQNYLYIHPKSEELLKDIPQLHHQNYGLFFLDNDSPHMWNLHKRTLCLNTWYGVSPAFKDTGSCTLNTLFDLFALHFKTFFDHNLHSQSSLLDFVPTIDYSKFSIGKIEEFCSLNKRKKILVCNGNVVSKQSSNFKFENILEEVIISHPNIDFIFTAKNDFSYGNVYFTDNLIQKKGCDLNEISFLSLDCDIIIGRSSGPYIYSYVKENLMNQNKTFICFNDHKEIADWVSPSNYFKCDVRWSNKYDSSSMQKIIKNTIADHLS